MYLWAFLLFIRYPKLLSRSLYLNDAWEGREKRHHNSPSARKIRYISSTDVYPKGKIIINILQIRIKINEWNCSRIN